MDTTAWCRCPGPESSELNQLGEFRGHRCHGSLRRQVTMVLRMWDKQNPVPDEKDFD